MNSCVRPLSFDLQCIQEANSIDSCRKYDQEYYYQPEMQFQNHFGAERYSKCQSVLFPQD